MDIIIERLPQTLWVVGMSYIVGIAIALPIGIYSAYKHYSIFDQAGTFITMIGYSIPPFFTGPLVIIIFTLFSSTGYLRFMIRCIRLWIGTALLFKLSK